MVNQARAENTTTSSPVERTLSGELDSLRGLGFTPYPGVFSGSDHERKTISTLTEKKRCDPDCKVDFKIAMILKIAPGFQAGFVVKVGGKNVNLDVRVTKTGADAGVDKIYKACKSKVQSRHSQTCTENCESCNKMTEMDKVYNLKGGQVAYVNQSASSTWSCNPKGCWSIKQGCTCGACWMEKEGKCVDVYKVRTENKWAEICVGIQGRGWCKNVTQEEVISGKDFGIILNSAFRWFTLGNRYVVDKNAVMTGAINDKNEFGFKFGAVQYTEKDVAVCRFEPKYKTTCFYSGGQEVKFSRCCIDTFSYLNDLTADATLHWEDSKIKKEGISMGTAHLYLRLKDVKVDDVHSTASISHVKVDGCSGCYMCEEGAILTVSFVSSVGGVIPISCSGATLKTNALSVSTGKNVFGLPLHSSKKDSDLSCKLGKISFKPICHLIEQPSNYHASGVSKLRGLGVERDCDTWCAFRRNAGLVVDMLDPTKWLTYVLWIGIIIGVCLAVFLAWKIYKMYNDGKKPKTEDEVKDKKNRLEAKEKLKEEKRKEKELEKQKKKETALEMEKETKKDTMREILRKRLRAPKDE